jgi:hypothetical protein
MLLPNKLFSYNESVLSKLPLILRELDQPKTPRELLLSLGNIINSPLELVDALDCLYALREIELNEEEGRIIRCSEK